MEGWGLQTLKPSMEGGGMDIFWKHTTSLHTWRPPFFMDFISSSTGEPQEW